MGLTKLRIAMAAAMVSGGLLLSASVAQATTWTVTNNADGAPTCPSASSCTLRGAVAAAAAGDTISLPAGAYTINGGTGPLQVSKNVTIAGAGPGATSITASSPSQLIYINYAELTLTGVTLTGGSVSGSSGNAGYGGAVYNYYGVLRVNNCAFTGNTANGGNKTSYSPGGEGGAIYAYGRTIISNSSFTNNSATGGAGATGANYNAGAQGGAIWAEGELRISSSTFSNNTTTGGATDAATTGFSGGSSGGAIYTDYGNATISASTFSGNTAGGGSPTDTNMHAGYSGNGGAMYVYGSVAISSSTFSGNTAAAGTDAGGTAYAQGGYGGGIYVEAGLTLVGSTVSGNVAAQDAAGHNGGYGGGIYNADGTLTISQSAITGNQAPLGYGGGIYNSAYSLTMTQSTIGPNNTSYDGAGIGNGAPATLTNVTIASNTASYDGGGLYADGVTDLANVTVFGNTAQNPTGGGNVYFNSNTTTLHDSLIAGGSSPTSGGNCVLGSGIVASKGYNAEDHNQCMLGGPGDKVNASLALGPLQNNGGPTSTIALMPGSQAIDAGDPSGCTDADGNPLGVDQRGVGRPQGPRCDIGAFEVVVPPPPPPPPPAPVAPQDSTLTLSSTSFAAQTHGASIAKPHQGTTVSYTDTQAAQTTFTVLKVVKGYKVGSRPCKAKSKHGKRPKHAKACTLFAAEGSFSHQDSAGANHFHFTGRVGGHALGKGSYELAATPKLGTLVGTARVASFKIV